MCNDSGRKPYELCVRISGMKKIRLFISVALILFYVVGFSSCMIATHGSTGKGTPKGWYKNSNNPHHPHSTNPGKGHDKKK